MTAPTDLELMMYFDGELPEPRRSEVRAFIESGRGSDQARNKLAGLGLVSEIMRSEAKGREPSEERASRAIAEGVMAAIARERAAEKRALPVEETPKPAPATTKVRTLEPPVKSTAAANDNGKLIFGLAAAAAAAAAALFIWGRTPVTEAPPSAAATQAEVQPGGDPDPREASAEPQRETASTARAEATAAPTAEPSNAAQQASNDEDAPRSVEVAAVNFGSRSGAIYYVSGDDKPTSTTVVWVRDE